MSETVEMTIVCARCGVEVLFGEAVSEGYFAVCPVHDEDLDEWETMVVPKAEALVPVECPQNDGGFDCTPFCPSCEGEQFIVKEIEV